MNRFQAAAVAILLENKKPMHYKDITKKALERGLLESKGSTPEISMNSQLFVDMKEKGANSDFVRVSESFYDLRLNQRRAKRKARIAKRISRSRKSNIKKKTIQVTT